MTTAIMVGATTPSADMTLAKGVKHALDDETKQLIYTLARRTSAIRPWQEQLRTWCDRADALYFAEQYTDGGADLWPDDDSAKIEGRIHISVNLPSIYVDVPAALQAVEPIENMLATDTTETARTSASRIERLYSAWKQAEDFDLKFHKAVTVKSLYGLTAARIYWDEDEDDGNGRVCLKVVEQPRNLWLGFKADDYEEIEWAAYVMRYEPNALIEQYGVDVKPYVDDDGITLPLVEAHDWNNGPTRPYLAMGDERIEVWDYWYRQPVWQGTTFVRMDTYNVVIAGNMVVRGPIKYAEYSGELPYIPLFNTFVPGYPSGRPDLMDVEPLIREKMERLTAGGQMIANGVAGDYWQLTGPDATRVPAGLKPVRNEIVAPGPGNRIETITPFIAQFQLEQYLGRIDRELAAVSGLNDLLLGLAPAQVLSSSKAINALIANYESRLSIRRRILYKWRRDVWTRVLKVWAAKEDRVKTIIAKGSGFLDIIDPSLSPRDEQETAMRAANNVAAKLWSQGRGMDAVGVDDPETEKQIIREESTDATLWPDRVQLMAQLLGALQSLGLNAPPGAQSQAQGQMTSGQADLRKALGAQTPTNPPGGPGPGGAPESQGQTPPIAGMAPEAGGPQPPFASGPDAQPPVMQSMVQGGKVSGRILSQQKLGRR
jgi:hypothetical protein